MLTNISQKAPLAAILTLGIKTWRQFQLLLYFTLGYFQSLRYSHLWLCVIVTVLALYTSLF